VGGWAFFNDTRKWVRPHRAVPCIRVGLSLH